MFPARTGVSALERTADQGVGQIARTLNDVQVALLLALAILVHPHASVAFNVD